MRPLRRWYRFWRTQITLFTLNADRSNLDLNAPLVGEPKPDVPPRGGRRLSLVAQGERKWCEESVLRVHEGGITRRSGLLLPRHLHPGHWHRPLPLLRVAQA